jgi:LmbE family N-acetylglucosaminyl deacetylase
MLKVMSIMAHQDDFEFTAGGTFAKLRKIHGPKVQLKILATTRGASGHHQMTLEQTFRRREQEALKSAAVTGAEYDCLTCLDGSHLPGQVFIDRNFLGGLWNEIRDFDPDIIFCPPVTTDPLAGIHIDHYNTAWAVRMVAYQLTVPHAYQTMNATVKTRIKNPVIVNVDDSYACDNKYDLAIDISDVYDAKVKMSLCHESQVFEWLPWNFDGSEKKFTKEQFIENFKKRHRAINSRYGNDDSIPREYFQLTRWGKTVSKSELENMLFNTD